MNFGSYNLPPKNAISLFEKISSYMLRNLS